MYEKVKAYVEKYHMLTREDKVIAGVSGGADSVCLLFMLIKLQKEIPFALHAVHVHHGIRGATADDDEQYVRNLCEEKKIPLTVVHENIPACAKARGLTEEEAGREVRRETFLRVLKEEQGTKIALAHHRNDNAETLLWNLCRGTGLKGLGGIAPITGVWIRPLLCVKRTEIESYLKKWGISYCTDETNARNIYTRNRIRNEIFPYMERYLNEQTVLHMAETAEQMRILGDYITGEVLRMKEMCTKKEPDGAILVMEETYRTFPEALRPYILHEVLCEAAGHSKDIEAVHVKALEELLGRQVGRMINLPYGVTAKRCYEGIRLMTDETEKVEMKGEFAFRIIDAGSVTEVFPQKNYTKWFDYDIIKNTVKIRHRDPGDYLTIDKNGKTQKLKQYFINEKIPQEMRDRIWLAADGPHIMWVVGYRQNQGYQVTEKTRRILEITYYGGEENGRDSKSNAG